MSKILNHWKTLDPVKVSHFTYGISGRRPILKHYEIDTEDKERLGAHGGVYFICCSTVKNDIYPVYVGVTSRSFKDRLAKQRMECSQTSTVTSGNLIFVTTFSST